MTPAPRKVAFDPACDDVDDFQGEGCRCDIPDEIYAFIRATHDGSIDARPPTTADRSTAYCAHREPPAVPTGTPLFGKSDDGHIAQAELTGTDRVDLRWTNNGTSHMRKLAICTAAALALSTTLALAQGSGAAGDIGSFTTRAGTSPPAAEQGTVGQGAAQTATLGPKAAKKTAKKKSASPQ